MKFDEFKIKQICDQYGITNYTIEDGLVNVDGSVRLNNKELTKLPVRFGKVTGHFDCGFNNLTSLKGSPHTVTKNFDCSENNLTSLKGSPKEILDDFNCGYNKLTSLEGGPNIVRGNFSCNDNNLTSLVGSPKEVHGGFMCSRNKNLISLKGAPELIEGKFYYNDTPIGSIYLSDYPGSITMFNAIFMDGVNMEKIEYWFSINNKPLTEDTLKNIRRYYEI
jgi:hypothetical protein